MRTFFQHAPFLVCLNYEQFAGQDAKKIMQGKAFYYEVGFSNDEVMGHFRKGEEPGESAETLRSFLSKLESGGKDISSLEIACHKVEPKIEKACYHKD